MLNPISQIYHQATTPYLQVRVDPPESRYTAQNDARAATNAIVVFYLV
ncbi:MAG: hypothetical protein MI923_22655 [Phycisphaerales bacterium]|nr:hypothetical protein [Phycisphaerales bacterium]